MQRKWIEFLAQADPEAAARLEAQTGDAAALAFTPMRFGTGGLRSLLGEGPGLMNRYTVAHASRALAGFAATQAAPRSIGIAYDTRHGSTEFAQVTAAIMLEAGFEVYLAEEALPTPLLSYAVRHLGLGWGVVITASHNPATYNGYKVYDARGVQALPDLTQGVAMAMDTLEACQPCPDLNREHPRLNWLGDALKADYLATLKATLPKPQRPIRVLYTALHGSGASMVSLALAGHELTCIQCTPDSDFGGLPAPNPEDRLVFEQALAEAERLQPELVLATDADSDRVGVLVPWEGRYQALSGNQIGALLADVCIPETATDRDALVTTIVSGALAQRMAAKRGALVYRTLTGFKYIGDVAEALKAQGKRMLLGYEESYGYLTGDMARDKDAVQACALLCALASQGNLYERWLSLCARYGHDAEALLPIELPPAGFRETMARVMAEFRAKASAPLGGLPVSRVVDYAKGMDGLPPEDVLALEGEGWRVLLRPSGTEPKIKCYVMAKDETAAAAQATCDALLKAMRKRLKALGI